MLYLTACVCVGGVCVCVCLCLCVCGCVGVGHLMQAILLYCTRSRAEEEMNLANERGSNGCFVLKGSWKICLFSISL